MREAGYTLLEVLVAFAIASVALVTLYGATGTALERQQVALDKGDALVVSENIMARVGLDIPLEAGGSSGERDGIDWSLVIEEADLQEESRWSLFRIEVTAQANASRPPVTLTTFRIGGKSD